MQQLPLHFPVETSYRDEDFLVSDCNREAWQAVRHWASAPEGIFLLRGEAASGKTHLAAIGARHAGAAVLAAAERRPGHDPQEYFADAAALVVEDCEGCAEAAVLFHLLNHARQHGRKLLLTVAESACWEGFPLPDLRSRLQALPQAVIGAPDDALIAALLVKHFQDRQRPVSQELIYFLTARIERSFAAVSQVVEALERQAASQKKAISVNLARQILTEC